MSKLETVKVVNEKAREGFMIINADDFDADIHEEFEDETGTTIPETPEDIDSLKKAELIDLLKAHGVDDPKGNVPDMKADLKKIMFTSL